MRRWSIPFCALLVVALACGGEEEPGPQDTAPVEDTTAMTPGGGAGDGAVDETDTAPAEEATTTGGEPTAATSPAATGAPSPPGGYAVESRPSEGGRLAKIEYASPMTVAEVAEFYDNQLDPSRRVEVAVAGEDLVAYGLTPVPR